MTAGATETWEQRIPREQIWPVLSGLLLVLLLASLDQTIVSTALPKVVADLKGFDRYSWVATAYLLTSTVTVPLYGKLSDIFGRKRLLLIGVVIFLVGSAVCGASQSMNQLILARGFQGLGAGALFPIVIATFGDLFSPRERGRWQGVAGGVFALSSIIGPTTGGWITDNFSWRWVFYVNLPVGILALLVLTFLMPPLRFGKPGTQIDYLGAALLTSALVPMLLAFTWAGSTYAWGSPQVLGLLGWSVLALIAFVLIELRTPQPIVEPQLFKNRIYSTSIVITSLIGATMFGSIFYIPLFVQGVIGSSATTSGTIVTPLMLTVVTGSIASGFMVSRTGRYRYVAIGGLLIMDAGSLLLWRLTVNSSYSDVLLAMLVMGLGLGLGMQLYTVVTQNAVPQAKIGQVTSGLTLFRQLGATVGLAVMGSFMTSRFQHDMASDIPASVRRVVPPAALNRLDNPQALVSPQARAAMHQAFSRFGPKGALLYDQMQHAIRLALAAAIQDVFVLGTMVALLATVAVFFLKEIPLRSAARAGDDVAVEQEKSQAALGSLPGAQTSSE